MGREYWFFAIKTAARMLNQVPGRVGRKLTSPFELVFGTKPDAKTWFEPFSNNNNKSLIYHTFKLLLTNCARR
jgi:hypothetical protein